MCGPDKTPAGRCRSYKFFLAAGQEGILSVQLALPPAAQLI